MKRTNLLALLPGVAGTALWYRRLILSGFERIPGDRGDPRSTVYLMEHWYQVFRGQAEALSPAMFYPVKGTVGYSEVMVLHSIPYSIMRLAGINMFSAAAAPLILFSFLNYLACFLLLRRVLGLHVIASVAAALFFAFNSPRFNHIVHFGYQAAFLLPVIAGCVIHVVQRRVTISSRSAFGFFSVAALSLGLQFLILPYQGWFFVFWMCLFIIVASAIPASRQVIADTWRRHAAAIAASALVFALSMIPFFVIYFPVAASTGSRPYAIVYGLVPDFWSLIQMGERNFIWGWLSTAIARVHPLFSTELNIAIGIVPSISMIALIVWSLKTSVRKSSGRSAVLAAAILSSAMFYAIGMRYVNNATPWHTVYQFVPGADGLRAIARFVLVLVLPMSIGFALMMDRALAFIAMKPSPAMRLGLTTAMLLIATFAIAEQFGRAPSFSSAAELSRLRKLGASLPDDCAVFYAVAAPVSLPVKHEYQIDAMLVSSMRHIPTVNGYGGKEPPGWHLQEVNAPDYNERVSTWITSHHLTGRVCRLEIAD